MGVRWGLRQKKRSKTEENGTEERGVKGEGDIVRMGVRWGLRQRKRGETGSVPKAREIDAE
jgi:hypothetical protein